MAILSHWLIGEVEALEVPGVPDVPAGLLAPHPSETTWRMGNGGAAVSPRVAAGLDLVLTANLYNNGVLCSYPTDSTLEAVVWRGGSTVPLFSPEVAWISSPATSLQMAIRGASTAGLEPGRYRLRVGVTVSGIRMLAYDGELEVFSSAGSGSRGRSYVGADDLALYYPLVRTIQGRSDKTNFDDQCADASREFERLVINRYMARPGFTRRRFAAYDPILGYDVSDPALAPPTRAQLTGWIASGGLLMQQEAREMVARTAIALVLDRVETAEGDNPYRETAREQRARVAELWSTYQAQLDPDLDGKPDWLIGIDATFLPAGAAP